MNLSSKNGAVWTLLLPLVGALALPGCAADTGDEDLVDDSEEAIVAKPTVEFNAQRTEVIAKALPAISADGSLMSVVASDPYGQSDFTTYRFIGFEMGRAAGQGSRSIANIPLISVANGPKGAHLVVDHSNLGREGNLPKVRDWLNLEPSWVKLSLRDVKNDEISFPASGYTILLTKSTGAMVPSVLRVLHKSDKPIDIPTTGFKEKDITSPIVCIYRPKLAQVALAPKRKGLLVRIDQELETGGDACDVRSKWFTFRL